MEPPGDHAQPPARTAPRRGLYAFVCVAAGILLADALPAVHPALWCAAVCAALIAAALVPARAARLLLAVAAVFLGAGSMSGRILWAPADRLALTQPTQLLMIRGTAGMPVSAPREAAWEPPRGVPLERVRIPVQLQAVQIGGTWTHASGLIDVFVPGSMPSLSAGDSIEAIGKFRPVSAPLNPGERDARRWAAQEARVGTLSVESGGGITQLSQPAPTLARLRAAAGGAIASLRSHAAAALDAALGPATNQAGEQSRALLRAMLVGGDDPVLRPVSDDMSRLGIVHILSISGFHLVLVAGVVVFLIRLTGDRGVWEYALAACAIGLYLLIIPAQAPVVRSGIMVLTLLLTEACGRRYDRLNVLAWTACVLALWRPLDIFSPGFQLSFGVTAVLIWRAAAWNDAVSASGIFWMPGVKGRSRPEPDSAPQWARARLVELCTATALAWCVSSAVVAFHVGVISVLGVVAGVILTLPSIAAIAAGFVAMLVALVWPAGAGPVAQVALLFSDLTVRGSHLAAQIPGSSLTLPQVPLAWTVAATIVSIVAVAPGGWRRTGTRLTVIVCAVWLTGIMVVGAMPVRAPTVDRFALPESSATLVRAADQAVLIDPGSAAQRSGAFTLRRAVSACGAWRVRTVIVTGPQTERFDHLPDLVAALGVQTVLLAPGFERVAASRPDGNAARLLLRLRESGVEVRTLEPDQALTIGDVSISIQGPGAVAMSRADRPATMLRLEPVDAVVRTTLDAP